MFFFFLSLPLLSLSQVLLDVGAARLKEVIVLLL
jgi:hypothetical protein